MRRAVSSTVLGALLAVSVAVLGCRPTVSPGQNEGSDGEKAAPKVINFAVQVEPAGIHFVGAAGGGGWDDVQYIFQDELFVEVAYDAYVPQLATEIPSFEKGTWQVGADGTMRTIWKLRPDVRWHDGTPFTSADLDFTLKVNRDPQSGQSTRHIRFMESVETPDPETFIIHWSAIYSLADKVSVGLPLPRHLLAEPYAAGGGERLLQSAYFMDEFVGLGPYHLMQWERGSHLVGSRFEQYYQGWPKLDQIIVRFISDPNAMVANILSGTLDVVATGIDVDAAIDVKRRWEGTRNTVLFEHTGKLYHLEAQLRPESAKPRDAFLNRDVRQAFYQAIDRAAVAEAVTGGLAPPADSYFPPDAPIRAELESWIPRMPYDRDRAASLLGSAGWVPGADGVRGSSRTSERLEVEIWAHPDATRQKVAAIVADYWKAAGAAMTVFPIPAARINDREYVYTTRPGWWIVTPSGDTFYGGTNKLHSSQTPTAANRWNGANYGGYSNPRADDLLDRLYLTIDTSQRVALHQQLVQELMGDVAILPLYWQVAPVLMLEGVSGPRPVRNFPTKNIFEWNKR